MDEASVDLRDGGGGWRGRVHCGLLVENRGNGRFGGETLG